MHDEQTPIPERPATEPVVAGPVIQPGVAAAQALPHPGRARWARVGLLGIAVAALIAAAALILGGSAYPTGTLAARGGGAPETGAATDLHGGPAFPGGGPFSSIRITAIDGSSISLQTEDGWTRTITVDDGTTYTKSGEDIALGDLAVGDAIAFRQTREDDGAWTIDAIAVLLPRVGGEVTAVDGTAITLELRGGTTEVVSVDGDTKIVVNGDEAEASDIEVGMLLIAEGTENPDGSLDATRVRAGDRVLRGDGLRSHGERGRPFGPAFGPGFDFGFGDGDEAKPDATTAPDGSGSAS